VSAYQLPWSRGRRAEDELRAQVRKVCRLLNLYDPSWEKSHASTAVTNIFVLALESLLDVSVRRFSHHERRRTVGEVI
jgi:hypothetical protein